MRATTFAALFLSALLANVGAQAVPLRPGPPHPRFCPKGTSWQYGCLKWGPAPPGKLFGACLRKGWGCMRAPGPIQ